MGRAGNIAKSRNTKNLNSDVLLKFIIQSAITVEFTYKNIICNIYPSNKDNVLIYYKLDVL